MPSNDSSRFTKCDVALFAGSGQLPRLALEELHRQGLKSLLLDLGCDDPQAYALAEVHRKIGPIELVQALRLMQQHEVSEVVMVGRVPHETLLKIRPWHLSWPVLKLWWKLPDTRTDTVLNALAAYFTTKGFPVISSLQYLKYCLISKLKIPFNGFLESDPDVCLGIVVAKTLGSVDVGQSIVIHKGSVLAVEAMEGTDRCLDRAIELGSKGAVLVKMAKPNQDPRFDVPTIGTGTFQRLIRGKFRALVVEEASVLCTDPQGLSALQAMGVCVVIADAPLIKKALLQYPPCPLV